MWVSLAGPRTAINLSLGPGKKEFVSGNSGAVLASEPTIIDL